MKGKNVLNRILCAVITAVICFSIILTSVSAATTKDFDINADGTFDVSDSTQLQMYLAGYVNLSASELEKADADGSGSVDVGDVTRMQMLLAGYTFEENTTSPTQTLSEYADEVIRLTNIERTKAGLSALSKNTDMCEVAQIRVEEAVKKFSHTRPNGDSCFQLVRDKGISYRTLGENLARGQSTPEQVVREWMNSPSHKDNILNPDFTGIGTACYKTGNNIYWVQCFIG